MIIWNAIAIQELQELYDYIFGKSPQNAEKAANLISNEGIQSYIKEIVGPCFLYSFKALQVIAN